MIRQLEKAQNKVPHHETWPCVSWSSYVYLEISGAYTLIIQINFDQDMGEDYMVKKPSNKSFEYIVSYWGKKRSFMKQPEVFGTSQADFAFA